MYKICKLWWLNNKCRCKESTNNNKWCLICNNNNNYNNKKNKRIKLYPKNLVTSQVLQLNVKNIQTKSSYLRIRKTSIVKNVFLKLMLNWKMSKILQVKMSQNPYLNLKISILNYKIWVKRAKCTIYLSNNKFFFYKTSSQIFSNHYLIKLEIRQIILFWVMNSY